MPAAQHLNPVRVLQLVEETLPDNSILVVDGGDFVGTAAHLVQPRGPLRWLDPGKEGLVPGAACTVLAPSHPPALGSPRGLRDAGGWCRICTWSQTVPARCRGESGCGRQGACCFLGCEPPQPSSIPPQVWCLFGDGAFGYSLIEFDTFVRHKVTGLPQGKLRAWGSGRCHQGWGGAGEGAASVWQRSWPCFCPLAKPWD